MLMEKHIRCFTRILNYSYVSICILVILSISCNVIDGKLKLLVDKETSITSPKWDPNGEYIYYSQSNGPLYKINLSNNVTELVSDQQEKITNFDLSHDGSEICFAPQYNTVYFLNLDSGVVTDSISIDSIFLYTTPIFSPTDSRIIYYLDWFDEIIHVHKVNRDDETDSILFSTNLIERVPCFDVSCDESWVAVGDTLFSLKGDDNKVHLEYTLLEISWHPTDAEYLVGTDGTYSDVLYFYDLGEEKWSKANVETYNKSTHSDIAFSPDGSQIALTSASTEGEFNNSDLWRLILDQ